MADDIENAKPTPMPLDAYIVYVEYTKLLNDFLIHFSSKSEKFLKQENDCVYLLQNGINTVTHVFNITLSQTGNLDFVIQTSQQAILYYTQFIDQIDENIMYDLNISSSSASIFVYKKTIYGLKRDEEVIIPTHLLDQYFLIYQAIVDMYMAMQSTIPTETIVSIVNSTTEIAQVLGISQTTYAELKNILFFIKHIKRYDYIYLFIKKYKKYIITPESLMQKMSHTDYNDRLHQWTVTKYIKWLVT
jgi:hypothetical protein